MSSIKPELQSRWECKRGKVRRLPTGLKYVDCPPANWVDHSCAAKLLEAFKEDL